MTDSMTQKPLVVRSATVRQRRRGDRNGSSTKVERGSAKHPKRSDGSHWNTPSNGVRFGPVTVRKVDR